LTDIYKDYKKNLLLTNDYNELKNADIVIICVPTPTIDDVPDLSILNKVIESLAFVMKKGSLIIIESTIAPGMTRKYVQEKLYEINGLEINKDYELAYCPERIDPGNKKYWVGNINRVCGATSNDTLNKVCNFYEDIIDAKIIPMQSIEEAELVKVWENSIRNMRIAQANLLAKIADKYNFSVKRLINGLNSKVEQFGLSIAFPGIGPGGHCIPEDIHYLIKAVEDNLSFTPEEEQYLDTLSGMFKDGVPSDDGLDEMQKKIANIQSVKNEYSHMELKLSQMTSLAKMADDEEEPETPEKTKLVPAGIVLMVIGLLAAAVATVFSLNEKYNVKEIMFLVVGIAGVAMALCGVVMMVYGIRLNNKKQRAYIRLMAEREENIKQKEIPIQELKEQLEQIQSGITSMEHEVSQFFDSFSIEADESQYQEKLYELRTKAHDYSRFNEQIGKRAKTKADYEKAKASLDEYLSLYGYDSAAEYTQALSQMKKQLAEAGFAKENMDSALQKKTQFENDNDMDKLLAPNECPYTLDELNEMISKVEGSLDEIRASLVQYGRQMDDLQEQLDMRDEKEQEYRNCKQIQAEEKHKYEILGLTSDYLTRAREQFTARYMAPISNGFQKYFGILTENTDRDWQVDANISIRMKEQGQLRDVRTMSAGYKDLIGICMRFALVDAMYPGEKPFLILDDPFVNLDDEKLARGRRLLAVLSQDYQVIYFTCHGSRE